MCNQASSVHVVGEKTAFSVPCGVILMTRACINFQFKDRREQRGTALFLWDHQFSPGGGLSGMLPSGRAGLCFRAELGCPGPGSPGREMWLWEMWCSRSLAEPGAGPSLRQKGFSLCFLPTWEWKVTVERPALYLCGKGGPWGFYLTLSYICKNAKGSFIFSPSVFILTEERLVVVCWIHSHRGLQHCWMHALGGLQ